MTQWYLVKKNWPQTLARQPGFAGVGGDVWPLDAIQDRDALAIHSSMMASRRPIDLGERSELLCADRSVAMAYCDEVLRHYGDAWLIELQAETASDESMDGFDLGFPSGGFSVLESELITQGLAGPLLNKWGLIQTRSDLHSYMSDRASNEDLEHVDGIDPLVIRVLRRGC